MAGFARTGTVVIACVLGAMGLALAWHAKSGAAIEARAGSSDAPVPVLVELFTSEGCSSCPPADRLLIDLLATQPVPGALVVGLSEHVDYWDRLGWRDPFSNARFSDRQAKYAATAHTANVYTPQMIVDGSTEFVGSDRDAALDAIVRAARSPKPALRLTWNAAPAELRMDLAPQPAAGADVFVAIVEDGLSSEVRAGENEGHRLSHAAVVRDLRPAGQTASDGAFRQSMRLNLSPEWQRSQLKAVVFATAPGARRVLAVAAIPLSR